MAHDRYPHERSSSDPVVHRDNTLDRLARACKAKTVGRVSDSRSHRQGAEVTPLVDLVYDVECPNAGTARSNLTRAFSIMGFEAVWHEHRIGDPKAPERVRGHGSPTVLVDGRDVAGVAPDEERCCRVYSVRGELTGAPSVDQIVAALAAATRSWR